MRPRLVIRLNSAPQGRVHWIRLDAEGRPQGHAESGTLAQAAVAATQRQVIGLVPATELLLTEARIPTQSRQRMLRAVPFALEDQLAEDIDELHFALGQRDKEGRLGVAVVSKERLGRWLEEFAEAGLDVDQLYPDVLALPFEPDAWTLLLEDHAFLLRTAPQLGFGGDADNLQLLLSAALEETGEAKPQRLIVYGDPARLPALDIPIEARPAADSTALLATSLKEREAIGLRSGEFARSRSLGINLSRWRVPLALLLAWVLVDTGSAYLQQWRLNRQIATVNAQIDQVYRSVFPSTGPVANPRLLMENRLKALRGGQSTGSAGLLQSLDKVGPVLSTAPNVRLNTLNYRNGNLDVEISAQNLQDIDQLAQRLRQTEGVKVEVRSASAGERDGERAQARLTIEVSS